MELIHGSETSAYYRLTPGKYPKEYIQYSNHGESLKSTKKSVFFPLDFFTENLFTSRGTQFGKSALDLQYIFRVLCPHLIQLCFSHSKHCVMLKWTAYVWSHCTWQWMGPSPSEEASRLAVAWLSPRANTCKRCAPSMGRPSARVWERAKM